MLNTNNIIRYNILLLPFFIASGPFLSDLSVTISCFYALYLLFIKKINLNIKVLLVLLFFFVLLNISSAFSDHILFSFEKTILIFRFILFAMIFNFFLQNEEMFIEHFFYSLLISIIISLNLGFIKLFYYYLNDFSLNLYLFSDEKIYGTYIFYISCIYIPIYLIVEKKLSRFYKIVFFSTLIFSFLLIIFSDQRIMMLSYLFLFLFFLIKYLLIFNLKRKAIISLCLIMVLAVSITNNTLKNKIYLKTYNAMLLHLNEEKFNYLGNYFPYFIYTDYHNAYYDVSIQAFKSNPWFGKGPNTFRFFCSEFKNPINEKGCSTHPHNYYFQLLAEGGIFIFLILCFSYFYILGNFIQKVFSYLKSYFYKNYNDDLNFSLIITSFALLLFLNPVFPSSNFFNNYTLIYLSLIISIYFYLLKMTKINKKILK